MLAIGSGQFGFMKDSSKSVAQRELELERKRWVDKQEMNYSSSLQAKDNSVKTCKLMCYNQEETKMGVWNRWLIQRGRGSVLLERPQFISFPCTWIYIKKGEM